jgi:hypothetical protein
VVADDWARTVYRPVVAQLSWRRLPEREPDLTVTELFLAFQNYAADRGVEPECEESVAAAVATFARLRRMPWLAPFVGQGGRWARARGNGECLRLTHY